MPDMFLAIPFLLPYYSGSLCMQQQQQQQQMICQMFCFCEQHSLSECKGQTANKKYEVLW